MKAALLPRNLLGKINRSHTGNTSSTEGIVYHEIFHGVEISERNAVERMIFMRTDDYGRSIYLGTGVG